MLEQAGSGPMDFTDFGPARERGWPLRGFTFRGQHGLRRRELTARAVSGAVERLSERLVKAGVKLERTSPLLPLLDDAMRVYSRLVLTAPGLPATAMPTEGSEKSLPVGVQIIGPFLQNRTPIAFAALIERELGGFVHYQVTVH